MVNNVEIKVIEISNGAVKLGVSFPEGVVVLRKEVYDRIMQANLEAVAAFEDEKIDKVEKA